MAAFHFTAKIHSRSGGRNAVRAAAYRAGESLWNAREARNEDYTRKADVLDAAILAPVGGPAWVHDRETLWNRVEAAERRRDAQVAQELEINLPRELSDEENWRLITDFAREHLVAHGRICDVAVHKHEASDGGYHIHAHILMPTRSLKGDGFGDKHPDCSWRTFIKRRDRLVELREVWCDFGRKRALELGIDLGPGWDERSFEDRGLDQEGQPKWGATAQRMEAEGTAADRTAEILAAQRRNGEQLLANPWIALEALTARHSTFTQSELARYIFTHSAPDQYDTIVAKANAITVRVGRDDQGVERLSSEAQIDLEQTMVEDAAVLAARGGHSVNASAQKLMRSGLSGEQREAAAMLLEAGDLACLVGYAGAGKSTMLAGVRAELEASGHIVRGAALSGIAAQNLTQGSGIEARTLASLRYGWAEGKEPLTAKDVLVVDEAGMIGSRELAGLLATAKLAQAKVILVGDPEQLQAIESGAAFRAVAERTGYAELREVRRQRTDWQRQATHDLATSRTAEAVTRYADAGMVESAHSDDDARALLVQRWREGLESSPDASRIMLAHTRANVQALNEHARTALQAEGWLIDEQAVETSRGTRAFATGDRMLFLRNERNLGVKNGTLGTVAAMADGRLRVVTDEGRTVTVDPAIYKDVDHGYAVTIHKSQGVTVDEAYVLASRGFDRHLSYVSMSRHRDRLAMVWSEESFGGEAHLLSVMGRDRSKDVTLDYFEELAPVRPDARSEVEQQLAARMQRERQREARETIQPEGLSDIERALREREQRMRDRNRDFER